MHIPNRKELRRILSEERALYLGRRGRYQEILRFLKAHPDYYSWKYARRMRITCFYYGKRKNNPYYALMYLLSSRRMNMLGRKLGIEAGENVFDEGLVIYHTQGIVINGNARVGKNCRLYGNNCIGNDGIHAACPIIGDGVRICVGAKVIGDVHIANHVVVAAGAVVVKSCDVEHAVLAGIPAKVIAIEEQSKRFLD
ncbi:poly-gamma-glutamate biosynthesis protein [Bifidobacterium callitrichidarum]|uniref:Poly-gamma-glutamate biosynthesis protein n=1 Tax=Bifidobacterium callitrichidarum TaxID=2052941 RepID=A0A2U2N5F5_9BIFI|nr:poly-gamma-glutamate biosynthesis protein [Bifidobacterium callitrichidarum]PWG64455.1 poly-gamma-glutamate biosynthesis protein [Bifidobacterium callitrichidarum]